MDWLSAIGNFFINIFDSLIDWGIGLINGFLSGLGDYLSAWLVKQGITLSIPDNVFDVLNEITLCIGYILPLKALMPIVTLWLGYYVAKIVFAVYRLIASTIIKRVTVKV